jgi:hypothetical protein
MYFPLQQLIYVKKLLSFYSPLNISVSGGLYQFCTGVHIIHFYDLNIKIIENC